MLGADDDTGVRPRPARRCESGHRPGRRSVLEMSVQAGRQPEQLREPVERHLLELLQRRRGAPEDSDLVQPGDQQLGEDPRLGAGGCEVGEEAGALPVRDRRQEHVVEVAQDRRERLSALGRRRRELRAQLARLDLGEDGKLAHALEVRRDPVEGRGAVVAEAHLRSFSISGHGRVFRICAFVSQARRAWATPSST